MSDLYRVTIGQDVYLGTAEEVVGFMARADGSPASDPDAYMAGVAERLRIQLAVEGIPVDDPSGFLEALAAERVLQVEVQGAPSEERRDLDSVLGDGMIAFGEGVDPSDVDLG